MSSSFYLAARFSRREELRRYRSDLQQIGHHVTSSWLDIPEEDPSKAIQCARQDIADIVAADCLIAFTETERSPFTRGGRHFEAGFAYAVGKRLLLVGPVENIFYAPIDWEKFATWEACMTKIANVNAPKPQRRGPPKLVKRTIGPKNPATTIVLTPWESQY